MENQESKTHDFTTQTLHKNTENGHKYNKKEEIHDKKLTNNLDFSMDKLHSIACNWRSKHKESKQLFEDLLEEYPSKFERFIDFLIEIKNYEMLNVCVSKIMNFTVHRKMIENLDLQEILVQEPNLVIKIIKFDIQNKNSLKKYLILFKNALNFHVNVVKILKHVKPLALLLLEELDENSKISLQIELKLPLNKENSVKLVKMGDPEQRFQGLCMIVDSKKTLQPISDHEMQIFLMFLSNLGDERMQLRKEIVARVGNFLERMKRLIYKHTKNIQMLQKKFEYTKESSIELLIETERNEISKKQEFFKYLLQFITNQLFIGSSLQRMSISVLLLNKLHQISQMEIDSTAYLSVPNLMPIEEFQEIIFWKTVTTTVRQDKLILLGITNHHGIYYKVEQYFDLLLNSIKASDVEVAISIADIIWQHSIDKKEFISKLVNRLLENMDMNEKDLIAASQHAPMNVAIAVLSYLKQSIVITDPSWTWLADVLITICKRICQITIVVCGESSPEGYIPKGTQLSFDNHQQLSQIILRNCFRSLQFAAETLSLIAIDYINSLDNGKTIEKEIGGFLANLLTKLRHRGAFTAVHDSYQQLCLKLGAKSEYDQLLESWLDDSLSQISNLQVSMTRRSAGLPSAIVDIAITNSSFIPKVINECFRVIASTGEIKDRMDLPQVHAMNVLKALVTAKGFDEATEPFLTDIFMIAINAFESKIFPLRNCAGMLFAGLINKIFGVAGKMELKEFFSRFKMLDIVIETLKKAKTVSNHTLVLPTLIPILGLVKRLKTSKNDEKSIQLRKLITPLCSSKQWKIRELAALAIVHLVSLEQVEIVLFELLHDVACSKGSNESHGLLMQVQNLLDFFNPQLNVEFLKSLVPSLEKIVESLDFPRFAVARGVLLKIIYKYFKDYSIIEQGAVICFGVLGGLLSTKYCPNYDFETAANLLVHYELSKNRLSVIIDLLQINKRSIYILRALVYAKPSGWDLSEALHSEMKQINDYCMTAIVSEDVDMASAAFELLFSAKLLNRSVISIIQTWLKKSMIPFHFVSILLQTFVYCLKHKMGNESDWVQFFNFAKRFSDSYQPIIIRLSVAKCLLELADSIDDNNLGPFAVILNTISMDDDEDVRKLFTLAVAKFLGWSMPLCENISRREFSTFVTSQKTISDQLLNEWLFDLTKPVILDDANELIVFEKEDVNGFRERPVYLLQYAYNLMQIKLSITKEQQRFMLDTLQQFFHDNVETLTFANDISWKTCFKDYFELALQLILTSRILKNYGDSRCLDQLKHLEMYPWLKLLTTEQGWTSLIRDLC